MHSLFTPECFLTLTAKRRNTGSVRKENACERKQLLTRINIEEIQQEKQAAFALDVEKMWSVLFFGC